MQTVELTSALIPHRDEVLTSLLHKQVDEPEVFRFGPYCLIPSRRLLLAGQDPVELGSRAFDILVLLVKRRGEVVTPRQIFEHVWPDLTVEDSNIRVQISDLRQALSSECQRFIATVRGRGYVFVAPIQRVRSLEA
jgi:DNA-binding winged helix-turn-helix (wHTH) protein